MKLTAQRQWFTDFSVCGTLAIDGNFECFTLEPPVHATKPCCIPAGTYPVELAMSPHRKYVVPWVLGVPGFIGIEIHIGNQPKDTEGCCLVGQLHNTDCLGNSAAAFHALMLKLAAADNISITYLGGPETV
jgi:hypothetical protein